MCEYQMDSPPKNENFAIRLLTPMSFKMIKMNESFPESTRSFHLLNEPNDTQKRFVHFDK